jgi:hypothetical protein
VNTADLISSFSTGSSGLYTVTRRQSGSFLRGIAQATTDATFTITASIQPASGKDLLRLPEGRRADETRTLYTATQLYTGDQGLGYEADLISLNGELWEVQHIEDWLQWAGQPGGYRCIIMSPTPGGGP